MNIEEFDYSLPESAIAQKPAVQRDQARLLVLDRQTGSIRNTIFRELPEILSEDDLLVLNDTRVIPARISLRKKESGGKVEILVLRESGEGRVEALVRGRVKEGLTFKLGEMGEVKIEQKLFSGKYLVSFQGLPIKELLNRFGEIPLPPYIKHPAGPEDREYYQTVYGKKEGAVAAPTAGLHFTPELLSVLKGKGTEQTCLTLHTGWGTFQTVRVAEVTQHRMEAEFYEIPEESARIINTGRKEGKKIVAVGTTTVRTLEGNYLKGCLSSGTGSVNIFIYPGYHFQMIDTLITNFHLPRTTTLLLTAAFAGKELLLKAYDYALKEGFRFGSYGDAMLIL
ncbi:MAG: tRNA preQ1(34) S-adenosylmethionine ribosyltransferase-isomerase QueA [Candidatus Omnitrophota bacterium]